MKLGSSQVHTVYRVRIDTYRNDAPAPSPGLDAQPTSRGVLTFVDLAGSIDTKKMVDYQAGAYSHTQFEV